MGKEARFHAQGHVLDVEGVPTSISDPEFHDRVDCLTAARSNNRDTPLRNLNLADAMHSLEQFQDDGRSLRACPDFLLVRSPATSWCCH
jgi:hypothetical protein